MGVNSLWGIVGQTARPVRLESLSRKKLAVDASIWIYQFLKAVRDSDGNTLPSSHIVGFFRRICKLLYFGILPVFVFDGGAPVLKRTTINRRKERRDEQRESSSQTAKKLLAIQVQRKLNNDTHLSSNKKRKRPNETSDASTEYDDENVKFMEDIESLQTARPNSESDDHRVKSFRKTDEYHLPKIEGGGIAIHKDDQRLMPKEEFQELSELGYDYVDGINIDSVDPSSAEFDALPMPTQYMILSHLRLRSRLRMGYDKEHLQSIFPNSMEFSKFQVQQVQKRNFYTQRLMTVAGMNDDGNVTRRIAGSKDREYALARSENGWTLSLNDNGSKDKPIKFDEFGNVIEEDEIEEDAKDNVDRKNQTSGHVQASDSDSDSDFEDVPIEKESSRDELAREDEDEELQRALIHSIYDQYKSKDDRSSENVSDKINSELDDKKLRNAIANSKRDLEKLKQEEMIKKKVFNFQKKSSQPREPDINQERGLNLKLDSDLFSKSVLFNSNSPAHQKEPHTSKDSNLNLSNATKLLGKDEEGNSEEGRHKVQEGDKNVHTTGYVVPDIIEFSDEEDEINKDTEKEDVKSNSGPKPVIQKLPSWFDTDISEVQAPFQSSLMYVEKTAEPSMAEQQKGTVEPLNEWQKNYLEDEKAGLVNWNDIREEYSPEQKDDDDQDEEIVITDYKPMSKEENDERDVNDEVIQPEFEKSKDVADLGTNEPINDDEKAPAITLDYDFEEEDEKILIQQIEEEEQEHEDFKSKIMHENPLNSIHSSITEEQLLQEKFQKSKRDSDEVTQTMVRDVQELLKRFGIPYITAPMEAEAQCAELMKLGLVDGIVTDDSDCFLFGGDRIYKNMFNQKNYVECYIGNDIANKLGLDQNKLIELALLLGSDYTDGIKGVGPVLAMEILAEFGNLSNFKSWFDENSIKTKDLDNSSSLKKSLLSKIKSGKFFLPETFPNQVVTEAYTNPEVDKDDTKFQWGVPNLDRIRSFLMYNVKWTQGRVDEVLVPLIRDINRKKMEGTQSTLGEFFPQELLQTRTDLKLGARMKKATDKLRK